MSHVKFVFASDTHGDFVCQKSVDTLIDFCKRWKPDVKIHGGDYIDARALRRGASIEERSERFAADIEEARKLLYAWKPNIILNGNHDTRVWEAMNSSNGFEASAAENYVLEIEAIADRLKAQLLPYHVEKGVYDLHGIKFIHGYRATSYPAKAHGEVYGDCIFGHVHRFDYHSMKFHGGAKAMAAGCMCRHEDMGYMDKMTAHLSHQRGFIYGIVNDKTGNWQAWNAEEIDGEIVFPW